MSKKLILLRHGQSQWNLENRFTGWTDVDLTQRGRQEAHQAGQLISKCGFNIEIVYVSLLKRAVNTSQICLDQLENQKIKVIKDWRLNERHYGDLQGLNKAETAKKFGEEQVLKWRRSFEVAPPKIKENDPRHPSRDSLYNKVDRNLLPSSESLKDTVERITPFLNDHLIPKILENINLLVVAHGNSLRALIKIFKKISDKDVLGLNIPTGVPLVVEFSENLKVVNDYYLGNQREVNQRTAEVKTQGNLKY